MASIVDQIQKAAAHLKDGLLLVNKDAFASALKDAEGAEARRLIELKQERRVLGRPVFCGSEVGSDVVPAREWNSAVQDGPFEQAVEAYWGFADSPTHSNAPEYILLNRTKVDAAQHAGVPVEEILDQFHRPYLVVDGIKDTIVPVHAIDNL